MNQKNKTNKNLKNNSKLCGNSSARLKTERNSFVVSVKIPSPFKRVYDIDDQDVGDYIQFEAVFDLPNDGTSTPNQLVFHVKMESSDSEQCDITIIGRTYRDTLIGSFPTSIFRLANVLYGFAQIKTKTVTQLVINA